MYEPFDTLIDAIKLLPQGGDSLYVKYDSPTNVKKGEGGKSPTDLKCHVWVLIG